MAKTLYEKKKSKEDKFKTIDTIGLDAGKIPPQAIDIEEAVIGALLVEPNAVADALDTLNEDCFYKEVNRKIFKAISSLYSQHSPIDILTVAEELKKDDSLDLIGGPYYLSQLSSKIGAAAHLDYHIKILLQKFIQRELISISYDVQKDSFDDTLSVDDLLDSAQQKLFTLADRNIKVETKPIREILNETFAEIDSYRDRSDGLSGLASGYTEIDKCTLGWQKSDLIIVAARPAMGKTAFVLTMARNMTVDHNIPVAFFSLEMSSVQLAKRLLVAETGLSSDQIRGGKRLAEHELIQIKERTKALAKAPLYIDSTPSLSIYEFRSKARKLVRNANVKMIIIDYLQLMTGPPELRGMREQEVANISRSLKSIAKELSIPIIALSQLSRAVEVRGGARRPQLSDLRESGSIEQDADIVLFIHRPDYYGLQEDPSQQGLSEIIIAKHRNGSTKDIKMKFRSSEAKFVDLNEVEYSSMDGVNDTYSSKMNREEFIENNEFN